MLASSARTYTDAVSIARRTSKRVSCATFHHVIICGFTKAIFFFFIGEMVIEYAGELIRSTLTDKRERNYNSRGIGCYMFKIDDNLVVDATMRGNAARFINHSCEVSARIFFSKSIV